MIPYGSEPLIRRALSYMDQKKVLQWARTMICANISERDIRRIARDMKQARPANTDVQPIERTRQPSCNGVLPSRIEAYMERVARLNGYRVDDLKRKCYGWV